MTDTEKKIAEIREALEKATPGQWYAQQRYANVWSIEVKQEGRYPKTIANVTTTILGMGADDGYAKENAHLIANAPEWLGFLLDELERKDEVIEEQKRELFYKSKEITELREKSWQDQQWFKQASANITEMQKELDREREENRKLREENRFQKKVIESYTRILHARAKDWERLFEEREMLIEGLRKIEKRERENGETWWEALESVKKIASDTIKAVGVEVEG